ncbi:MAG: hypothetical protein ACOH1N_08135 [Lutibacter sp.]
MKKLLTICLLIAIAHTSQAQDGKPTKEQTVQFIKDYMSKIIYEYSTMEKGKGWYISKGHLDENFKVMFDTTNNNMTITYQSNYDYRYFEPSVSANENSKNITYNKVVLDLSKIESVFISTLDFSQVKNINSPSTGYGIYLVFNTPDKAIKYYSYSNNDDVKEFPSNSELKQQVMLPIISYSCNGCDHQEVNKKIVQAFNHLRKLCGAPEPISFD